MPIERPQEDPDPSITVVIPTVPGADCTPVLDSIANQTFEGPFEVLVVRDDELDICEARNKGLRAAHAEVVAFTDDDCEPPPEWLAAVHDRFQSNPELGCLEGPVEGGISYAGEHLYVGCNIAVRPEAAFAVGGFRSEYAGWRDDTEFGWRMERDSELQCVHSSAMRMCHPPPSRSDISESREQMLRFEYPDRYNEYLHTPYERFFQWLEQRGVIARLERTGVIDVLDRVGIRNLVHYLRHGRT